MNLDSVTLGVIIILSSVFGGIFFCLCICIFLWLRHKSDNLESHFSFDFHRPKKENEPNPSLYAAPPPSSHIFRTISNSEPENKVCSPMVSLTSSSPLNSTAVSSRTNFRTFTQPSQLQESSDIIEKESFLALKNCSSHSSFPSQPVRPNSLLLHRTTTSGTLLSTKVLRNIDYKSSELIFQEVADHSPAEMKPFLSDTDESLASPLVLKSSKENMHRVCLGFLKIRVRYQFLAKCFRVDLIRNIQLPNQLLFNEMELYTKLIILNPKRRFRKLRKLNTDPKNSNLASFSQEISYEELLNSSMTISLCKSLDSLYQGLLIGSASTSFERLGMKEHVGGDYDSGTIKLDLHDSAPHQMVDCGGILHLKVECNSQQQERFLLKNIVISAINLKTVSFKGQGEMYLKISIQEHNRATFWRRTRPVPVYNNTSKIVLAEEVLLPNTLENHELMEILVSVRLKTGKRGERRIIGSVNLTESWNSPEKLFLKTDQPSSTTIDLDIPIQ